MAFEYAEQPPETRRRWKLMDQIETGELTEDQRRCLSGIVECLALSPDRFGADALLSVIRVHYNELINLEEK